MSAVLATILIISVIFIIYGEIRKWFIKRKMRNFESPKQLPILGVAGRVIGKSNEEFINIVFDIFDEVKSTPIQVWFGPFLAIFISEPPDIETILTSDDCLNKPYLYEHMKCKTSIIATNREVWKPHRRALNTAFNLKILQSFVSIFNHKSCIIIKQMEPFLQEPGDLYRTIFIGMIDMITKTTMGTEMNLQLNGRGVVLYDIVKSVMNNIQYRITRCWLRWDFMWNISKVGRDEKIPLKNGNRSIDEIYEKKVNELRLLKSQGIDYLEEAKEKNATNILEKCLILEQEGVFSHENVLDQMRVIILAGIDTSSITVFGTLLMLAINEKHQDLVVEELRSIFDSADSDVTQENLSRMQYLERVIKETLRLLSPVPFIIRKPSADIESAKGIIPRGAFVVINILHLHRNPKIWGENALEFDPDRFLPENIAKRPLFSYIPFSGGARNCIGMKYAMMSTKITLAHMLRRYKFITNLKFEDIRLKTHLVLEVINEKPLRMEVRNFITIKMGVVIAIILIISIIFIIYGEIRKWFTKLKLRNFKSPKQLPVLGVAARFIGKSSDEYIDIIFKAIDEVKQTSMSLWFGPILIILVCEPQDIQILLSSDDCLNKPYFYDHAKCKTSIIATNREIWKPHRRALNTAFNLKMLQSYVPLLNHKSRILVKQMKPFLQEPGNFYRTIFIGMIDMIIRTTMGTDMHLQSNGRGAFLYDVAKLIMNNIQYRITRFWLRWDFMWNISKVGRDEKIPLKYGNQFIDDIYEKKVKELQSLKPQVINYLEEAKEKNVTNILEKCLILEQEGVFSHENVLDQMRVIILAGIDTSSITVFGTLLMLAINQKHQDLVVEELRSIFDSADSDVTQENLSRMQYLERVIKESLRLLSPVPFIVRKPSANIELAKGIIPRGAFVVINILHLHRNPKIWGENALEFDPDRFLPENIAKRPPFSYIPFSGGARNCIGMKYAMISAKITLAHLLRRYKFITNLKFEDIRLKTHLVLEVINEKPLRMEVRNF
ncbi:uncharacterized protein LOC116337548 [Contarinia nasturtii]|uniref:uncharacterized protein LOC116337548 n=1 Tax=Contarinia nasturtii TaxID=265458 RepID=UPI0012D49C73|nr:uncharacterized protein LOC116337548 [Contarinia nasturtii]